MPIIPICIPEWWNKVFHLQMDLGRLKWKLFLNNNFEPFSSMMTMTFPLFSSSLKTNDMNTDFLIIAWFKIVEISIFLKFGYVDRVDWVIKTDVQHVEVCKNGSEAMTYQYTTWDIRASREYWEINLFGIKIVLYQRWLSNCGTYNLCSATVLLLRFLGLFLTESEKPYYAHFVHLSVNQSVPRISRERVDQIGWK